MIFLKQNWFKFTIISLIFSFAQKSNAFVQEFDYTSLEPAGFFSGIWHGLQAPWSLIGRWLIDNVVMYASPNTGWFYDLGFLLGIVGSVPIGWAVAILSLISHFLGF